MTGGQLALWILMAALTALVLALLLRPLLRRPVTPTTVSPDLAIYRDQLTELERDRAAGRLGIAEADSARREVERRLLRADAAAPAAVATFTPARPLAMALLLAVPALALGLYLSLGQPDLPAQPLAGRSAELAGYHALTAEVARLREAVQAEPEDALAWRQLGLTLILLGDVERATQAIDTALTNGAPPSETYTLVAEAIVRSNGGRVLPMARQLLANAIELDPNNWHALFLTGMALEQDGQGAAALQLWRAIAAEAPADLAWRALLEQEIQRLAGRLQAPAPTP